MRIWRESGMWRVKLRRSRYWTPCLRDALNYVRRHP